jgi:hypothetical protein
MQHYFTKYSLAPGGAEEIWFKPHHDCHTNTFSIAIN